MVSMVHGLMAGNVWGTDLKDAQIGSLLFTINWGTACFLVLIMILCSYLFRRALKKHWMAVHRLLTIGLLVFMLIHIIDVGIQLPFKLLGAGNSETNHNVKLDSDSEILSGFSGATLKDGVYEGSAQGYKSQIKVSVTVKKGKLQDIEILEENDTPNFFERAEKITDDIIEEQSLNVDAVSGATYSSAGIINAVNDALKSAVTEGELEYNEIETNRGSHHGHRKR